MNAVENSYIVLCLGFALWCVYVICMLVSEPVPICIHVSHHERQLSPHEQQPEPIPAVKQGWIDVERWVL